MKRRIPATWGLAPLVAAVLLVSQSVYGPVAMPDMAGVYGLGALVASALIIFGGWERRRWPLAAFLAALFVGVGGWINAWVVVRLLLSTGIPEIWLLETSAVLIAFGWLVAAPVGLAAAALCGSGLLRR